MQLAPILGRQSNSNTKGFDLKRAKMHQLTQVQIYKQHFAIELAKP